MPSERAIFSILGLVFFLVFAVLAVGEVQTLTNTAEAATTGGINEFWAIFPTLFQAVVGIVGVVSIIGAMSFLVHNFRR